MTLIMDVDDNVFLTVNVDSEKVTAEVKNVFGCGEPRRDVKQLSHEGLIARATQLCQELRSDPSKVMAKHAKGGKKRKRKCVTEHQKNLVLVENPGSNPSVVTPLREYEKVFNGSIRFSSDMDEDDIRARNSQGIT